MGTAANHDEPFGSSYRKAHVVKELVPYNAPVFYGVNLKTGPLKVLPLVNLARGVNPFDYLDWFGRKVELCELLNFFPRIERRRLSSRVL
ncbi:hypothetical protein [Thermococcus piezophilus]|uniref:hypothetical protein n=1 Tax=Thermococcus piezophilus TaxID=1712654 RepID=UPI001F181450|nr:hypothetical protein [Thermococcus piezophilus]